MPRNSKDQTPHPKRKTKQKKSKQLEEKNVEEDDSIVISDTEDTDYFESSQLSNSINRESASIDLDADKSTLSNSRHFSRSFASFEDQPVLYRSSPERTDNIMKTILKTPSPLQFSKPPKLRRFLSNESNISNISLASSYHFLNSQEMEEERRLFFGGDDEDGSSGNESLVSKNLSKSKLNSSVLSTITSSSSKYSSTNTQNSSNLLPQIQYYSTILIYTSISLVFLYFSLLLIYTFHQDYNWRYIEEIKINKLKIIECGRKYTKQCISPGPPQHMVEKCKEFNICRSRGENDIKRTELISKIFGDIASSFIDSFSYKAILFYFLFGCILLMLIKWVLITKQPTVRIIEVEKKRD
ncbi:hypothetical protein CONCODRAFT_79465 [Conidiobolus coronatus NRRL 28638]|uniref:Brl1/Brr6 domain-containing protein n=1 Tax=Conidiobolus coronatus (strain ATCC 28846 / CBS 209.66 / NRRL 28638) TaxID=796925 RepID=A0A137P2K1_CONC2|nr:hypothetical protein CONCODRAFT_79465 [Conidiobolus coronatus NRRL 28638]|eukprot:KXN69139.1 hypothetical protein CONCODRAFT_79465 [Conidiobolus coronatus NRRL 28638]